MREKYIEIHDLFEDIFIEVFLCGYEQEGESSVFVLYTRQPEYRILYSAVIDCYEDGQVNCTQKILESLSEKCGKRIELNMLVWTHPHDDHTKGLDVLIRKFCSRNTKIAAADIANSRIELSKVCQDLSDCLGRKNYGLKKRWNISTVEKMGDLLQRVKFTGNPALIRELMIKCIAPCTDLISQRLSKDSINDLCIGIVMEIRREDGNINFLFAADMEEKTIRELVREQEAEEIPNHYEYIKIPHHGGKSGERIVELLDPENKSQTAASTVYLKTMKNGVCLNPDKEVLKKYRKYIEEIDVTADVFGNKRGIGILRITYDLAGKSRKVETYGQAVRNVCLD